MTELPLKFFWVCPNWQFHAIRHDMDLPPSEVWVEAESTFVSMVNRLKHNVRVRATLFDTDFDPVHFPRPPDGTYSWGMGWFEIAASHRVYLTAWVTGEKKTAFSRAWGFALHLEEHKKPIVRVNIKLPDKVEFSAPGFFRTDRDPGRSDPRNRSATHPRPQSGRRVRRSRDRRA